MRPFFVSGIGTDVGKTIVSAILTEALQADYWKPVQAGFADGTDNLAVQSLITNQETRIFKETYKLSMAASPHISARKEGVTIDLSTIISHLQNLDRSENPLVIEGAGGLMVPLNDKEFVADLIKKMDARVILVSRNYLGSINHSLLTAMVCRQYGLDVAGWVFNDQYLDYESEISAWSGYPVLARIPYMETIDKQAIYKTASALKDVLKKSLC